ncbi:HAAS signaling domain-containing protein [Streptomyces sp. NPDC048445]|uniref:HAAS signaling domain-containing protein n=1 Tax=Streptomyces sp. NPDC048445 TaxID=3365553 RepID=UPI00371BC1AE
MKTDETLVRDYLAAVERETSMLPPAARQELIADLGEHIEVALAERPGSTREILDEMGDPRAIAATAFQELGDGAGAKARKPGRRRSPVWLPLVLLLVSTVLPYLARSTVLNWIAIAGLVSGVVIIFRARYWTVAEKWTGVALAFIVPLVIKVGWYVFVLADDGSSADSALRWSVVALTFIVTLAGTGYLWRTRRSANELIN